MQYFTLLGPSPYKERLKEIQESQLILHPQSIYRESIDIVLITYNVYQPNTLLAQISRKFLCECGLIDSPLKTKGRLWDITPLQPILKQRPKGSPRKELGYNQFEIRNLCTAIYRNLEKNNLLPPDSEFTGYEAPQFIDL